MIRKLLYWIRQLFVLPIRIYQGTISRITPATCRFKPTCSQYTVESIENRGIFVGGLYGFWRILRCHPFTDGGWDLPPKPKSAQEPAPCSEPNPASGVHECGGPHDPPAESVERD
jgi:uncharacterized protein